MNWLSKKVLAVYIKGKNVYCLSLIPSHTMFGFTFWKSKCIKTGIMTYVGKNRLVKVIFTKIHKISDACANSLGRYIVIAQCIRNVFTFY